MSNYLVDPAADVAAIAATFNETLEAEEKDSLNQSGPTGKIDLSLVLFAQTRIVSTGILAKLAEWRAEDEAIEREHGKHAGGAPRRAALTDEHMLIALMLLAKEHTPLWTKRIRDVFWFRLTDEARAHLGLDWGPETGTKYNQATKWHSRTHRAMERLLEVMDPLPAERRVMNRAERDHMKSLREKNRDRLNLDAKMARKNYFSFALIEMSFKEMGPQLLATWKGSVSIDQTTVRAASRRGFAKGESQDATLDSTVLELDANWAVKSPKRRAEEGSDHSGEATWGFMANFATMVAEDPSKSSPHPSLIASMTLSTPARNVGGEAVELLRQLQTAGYPAGRVTTDKEYAANMLPRNYALPVRALGYTIVTDYQKDRLGEQGHQRGALILDGKHKCPAIPAKLKRYNEKFVNGLDLEEDDEGYEEWEKTGSRKSKEQHVAELEAHDRLYRESAMYNFKQHEGPDETGAIRMSCPARGKSATASCTLVAPGPRTEGKDRVPILNPPANPPECCTREVLTMPVTEECRYLQEFEYQSPEWRRAYKTDRNLVELSNSHIKDEGAEAMANSGRRRLRGLTAQQVLVTFLVANANMRRIYAFRAAAELTAKQRPDRKPRARNALNLRNYDVRNAEVRKAQGLPPLEGSRRKDSKV